MGHSTLLDKYNVPFRFPQSAAGGDPSHRPAPLSILAAQHRRRCQATFMDVVLLDRDRYCLDHVLHHQPDC